MLVLGVLCRELVPLLMANVSWKDLAIISWYIHHSLLWCDVIEVVEAVIGCVMNLSLYQRLCDPREALAAHRTRILSVL